MSFFKEEKNRKRIHDLSLRDFLTEYLSKKFPGNNSIFTLEKWVDAFELMIKNAIAFASMFSNCKNLIEVDQLYSETQPAIMKESPFEDYEYHIERKIHGGRRELATHAWDILKANIFNFSRYDLLLPDDVELNNDFLKNIKLFLSAIASNKSPAFMVMVEKAQMRRALVLEIHKKLKTVEPWFKEEIESRSMNKPS